VSESAGPKAIAGEGLGDSVGLGVADGRGVGDGVGSGVVVGVSVGALVGVGAGEISALHASSESVRAMTAIAFLIVARSLP
jgi:putative Ca2+/H+ antiporter (TMEM165/GDT1 family)